MLRDHDLCAVLIKVVDNGIVVEGFVSEQGTKLDIVKQRCDAYGVKPVTSQ